MIKKCLILIIIIISAECFSQKNSVQHLDSLSAKFVNSLLAKKIDTVAVYETYSTGSKMAFLIFNGESSDRCNSYDIFQETYILWKVRGETFVTKMDNCFDYSVVKISQSDFWDTYTENEKKIASEEIKSFEYKSGNENFGLMIDHSQYQNFKIFLNSRIVEKRFDEFDFLEKEPYRESDFKMNINFEYNNALKSKLIMDLLSQITNVNYIKKVRV